MLRTLGESDALVRVWWGYRHEKTPRNMVYSILMTTYKMAQELRGKSNLNSNSEVQEMIFEDYKGEELTTLWEWEQLRNPEGRAERHIWITRRGWAGVVEWEWGLTEAMWHRPCFPGYSEKNLKPRVIISLCVSEDNCGTMMSLEILFPTKFFLPKRCLDSSSYQEGLD